VTTRWRPRRSAGRRDIAGRSLDQLVRLGIGCTPQVDDVFEPLEVFDPVKVSEDLNVGGCLPSPRAPLLAEPTAGPSAVLTESVLTDQVRALAGPGACGAVGRAEGPGRPASRRHRVGAGAGQVMTSAPAAEVLAGREVAEAFLGGRGRRQE